MGNSGHDRVNHITVAVQGAGPRWGVCKGLGMPRLTATLTVTEDCCNTNRVWQLAVYKREIKCKSQEEGGGPASGLAGARTRDRRRVNLNPGPRNPSDGLNHSIFINIHSTYLATFPHVLLLQWVLSSTSILEMTHSPNDSYPFRYVVTNPWFLQVPPCQFPAVNWVLASPANSSLMPYLTCAFVGP